MRFRFHRGELAESLETTVEFSDMNDLEAIIEEAHGAVGTITVKPYRFDKRINWDSHIVQDDMGVIGFTDGPVK